MWWTSALIKAGGSSGHTEERDGKATTAPPAVPHIICPVPGPWWWQDVCSLPYVRPLADTLHSTCMFVLTFTPLCSSEGLCNHTSCFQDPFPTVSLAGPLTYAFQLGKWVGALVKRVQWIFSQVGEPLPKFCDHNKGQHRKAKAMSWENPDTLLPLESCNSAQGI